MALIDLCERGLVPDFLTRRGIRQLCAQRLREEHDGDLDRADARYRTLLSELRSSPIAIEVAAANEQHYEVPTRFFELCLGRRLKYSSCYYPEGNETLDEAEEKMLALYGERADLLLAASPLEAVRGADALVIVTEWKEFRSPSFDEIRTRLSHPLIFDGRNLYDPAVVARHGLEYHSIGRPVPPAASGR